MVRSFCINLISNEVCFNKQTLLFSHLSFFLTSQRSANLNNLYSYTAELQSTSACRSSRLIECARSIPHGFVYYVAQEEKHFGLYCSCCFLNPIEVSPRTARCPADGLNESSWGCHSAEPPRVKLGSFEDSQQSATNKKISLVITCK